MRFAVSLVLLVAAGAATAGPPFAWPLDCTPERDCWIVRHVDRDPGPGVRDVACGTLTGDGHGGTDVALADMAALARDVTVRAPAAGRVVGVRDGMPDIPIDAPGAPALDGRDCGNGVRIDHGDGWVSQLCHLRRGSVRVRPGDRLAAGDALGLVGLSGKTNFPHLHVGFERAGVRVDPMDGAAVDPGAACDTGGASLFADAPAYTPLPLVGVGVATEAPDDADLLRGAHRARRVPASAPALVLWAQAYGTRAGDRVRFTLRGPDGRAILDHGRRLEAGHARGSYFAGRRRPAGGWPVGTYAAGIEWRRGDVTTRRRFVVEIVAGG